MSPRADDAKAIRDRELVTPIPKETRPWNCRREDASCTRKAPCNACRGARSRRDGEVRIVYSRGRATNRIGGLNG
jgi:hypothetical protein